MARSVELDESSAQEHMFENNWTDGLPVIAPTPERVETMLAAAGLAATVEIGEIKERSRVLTAEKAAINAVLAGCKP